MPEMELDEKAVTQAAKAICAVQSNGNCPPEGCAECINSDEYGFAPEARAAIRAYIRAAGLVSVPVSGRGK